MSYQCGGNGKPQITGLHIENMPTRQRKLCLRYFNRFTPLWVGADSIYDSEGICFESRSRCRQTWLGFSLFSPKFSKGYHLQTDHNCFFYHIWRYNI